METKTLDQTIPLIRKWYFWVILLIILSGLFALFMNMATNDNKKTVGEKKDKEQRFSSQSKRMSEEQLKAAEAAFANGITINDDKDDFMVGAEGSDATYSIPKFDAKSVSFGIDDKYIYRKCTYWEVIPKSGFSINGKTDININCSTQLSIDSDQNVETKWGKGQYHLLGTNYDYINGIFFIKLFIDLPDGATEEETNYSGNPYMRDNFGGMVYGGPGYNYYLSAWPLSKLRLQTGTAITISQETEVGSTGSKTHLAVDPVPHTKGQDKDGPIIKYILGENHYQLAARQNNLTQDNIQSNSKEIKKDPLK